MLSPTFFCVCVVCRAGLRETLKQLKQMCRIVSRLRNNQTPISMVTSASGQNSVNTSTTWGKHTLNQLLQIYWHFFIESKIFKMQLSNHLIKLSSVYVLFSIVRVCFVYFMNG